MAEINVDPAGREDVPLKKVVEHDLYEVPTSNENPVPKWLLLTYIVLPIWGIFFGYYFINGTTGWLDRGYWQQLQIGANTTFPARNYYKVGAQEEERLGPVTNPPKSDQK